ncbi:MAG: lipoyl(octanoyl) transferase LipB [Prevotella sp.]|nr:lipoyl(octanoyl) transferase LipB [Prevotella sp.]MCM1075359.1 lipoyl(octanoyl) transferase LipB [Ruminococcus sp.]
MTDRIKVIDLGLSPYRDIWLLQQEAQKAVIAGETERIYLTEHKDVYTLGKHGHPENLLLLPERVECIRIERGGDITYHGPGQLVVYPIINLHLHRLGVKQYINILEEAVIRTIADFGVKGERVEGATGVWVGVSSPAERKICAIGVKISRGVTMHGLALNVNTRLSAFSAINPCGFTDKGVTSLQAELGRTCQMDKVKSIFCEHLQNLLLISNHNL